MPLLSLIIMLPIIGGVLILIFCGAQKKPRLAKVIAVIFSFITLIIFILIFFKFDPNIPLGQMSELYSIISKRYNAQRVLLDDVLPFTIFYFIGIDGISFWFVGLNVVITTLALIYATRSIQYLAPQFFACILIIMGLINGAFLASDAILFFMFFESSFIPMYLLIGIWGGEHRKHSANQFFLFMLLGSIILLLTFVYIYTQSGDFVIDYIPIEVGAQLNFPTDISGWYFYGDNGVISNQKILFWGLISAFLIKLPLFPWHLWLPSAHTQAPTPASVILAAIMLKLGGYGIIRFVLPIVPDAARLFAPVLIGLALISIIYFGLIILRTQNLKTIIAYSSIVQMAIVLCGLFVMNLSGIVGGVIQMLSHGFIAAGLFICAGVLYERINSYELKDMGGIINIMPKFSAIFIFLLLANIGLPATSGFVGEFMVLTGISQFNFVFSIVFVLGLIISTIYSLGLIKKIIFGDIVNENIKTIRDIDCLESIVLTPICVFILILGVYPQLILNISEQSLQRMFYLFSTVKHPWL